MHGIRIEVVLALPSHVVRLPLDLPAGSTIADALAAASAHAVFPGVDLQRSTVGIFGKVSGPGDALRDGDRVEIYRGPPADAKAARRARAKGPKRT